MPSGTQLQQFIDDLREGKSKVCRAFDDLFGTPEAIGEWRAGPPGNVLSQNRGQLRNANFWPKPPAGPPPWAVDELMGNAPGGSYRVTHKLTPQDINHITDWPADQMDLIRDTVNKAIDDYRPVQFWWKLWDGGRSEIEISRQSEGAIFITFLTPRSYVTYPAANQVDIKV
jgi:hypothetical protein